MLIMLKPAGRASTTVADLHASVQGRLAAFKIPTLDPCRIFLTETELPRGATGKILKREIRDTYATRSKL